MDDSNGLPPPAKRQKRTDENGQHCEDEHGSGTSQTRCTTNKSLCEVCSKPDCGECANCLNITTGHQACRLKPKENCLTYIKMEKERAKLRAVTTTHVISQQNANGDLVASAHAGVKESSTTDLKDTLQQVSSKLSSLASKYSDCLMEVNQLKGIIDQALCSRVETSTLAKCDENGKHCEDESDKGTSQAKRFAKCTSNKVLCEVCSKPDCGECSSCLNRATGHQACTFKPKEKCLTYIKVAKIAKETAELGAATTTHVTSEQNATNGDLVTSAHAGVKESSTTNPTVTLQHVSSKLSPLASQYSMEVNKLKGIISQALYSHIESPKLAKCVTSGTSKIASITSTSKSPQDISQYETLFARNTASAATTSLLGEKSTQEIQKTTNMSSITDVRNTAVASQQHNSNMNQDVTKIPPKSSVPDLKPSVAVLVSSMPNSTSACARHVPQSIAAISSRASTNKDSVSMIDGTRLMGSSQPTFIENVCASTSAAGQTGTGPASISTSSRFPFGSTGSTFASYRPNSMSTDHKASFVVQTPVSLPPTASLQLTSPTAFQAQSSSYANQCLPSTSALMQNLQSADFVTPSLTVKATMEAKVMQKMKEAFSSITVDLHVTKCGISGPPGTGKTHIKALLLNQPCPTQRESTALSTRAEEVTNTEFLVNCMEMRRGLRWTVLQKDHWARLLANTIYNSTPPIDSSHQSSSRVGGNVATTSAVPIRDVSGMTYKLLLEMYRENKPKRKRATMDKIHLMYFVDTGGQPQFQEILPNFVRSSINFLVHKLSEKLVDCPQFEYWLNGNKYTIPEALRVSNMSIITQSVRSVCSSIRSEQCDQRSPTVAILGTFKDELKAQCGGDRISMEEIIKNKGNSIEGQLQNYVGQGARKCSLMKCTRDSCIFPVDASEEGWKSNSDVIETLRNKVQDYSNKVQLKGVPLSYFVFLNILKEFCRRKQRAILEKCLLPQVIEQSHISLDAAQIEEALNLFADVNLILYFPSSSMLNNFIFVDPNFLYERVTEIIVASFHRFGSSTNNNFISSGIFTDLLLDQISSLNFTEYPNFTRQMFLSLLQDLFIIAELEKGHYFMPCVLKLEDLASLSPEIKNSIDEVKMYMNYHEVSGPLIIYFGDKISPRGLFCAMVAKLSRNFGWRLNEGPNSVRCRNMIEFNVYNNASPAPLGTAILCDKLTHLEVYTTCEKFHCCIIRKAVLSSLYAAGSSLKYSFTAIDAHAGFYCNTCPAGSLNHHTIVSQRENTGVWQKKCSLNPRNRAVPLDSQQNVWFESNENYSRVGPVPTVKQVIAELIPNTNRWYDTAVYLEIDLTQIERIRQDKDNEQQRFYAVVEKWQKNGRPPFTWSTLVQVLTSQIVQEHNLAENIRKKYLLI